MTNTDTLPADSFLVADGARGFHGQLEHLIDTLIPEVIADVTAAMGGELPDLAACDAQDMSDLADAIERVTYERGAPIWWEDGDVYGCNSID